MNPTVRLFERTLPPAHYELREGIRRSAREGRVETMVAILDRRTRHRFRTPASEEPAALPSKKLPAATAEHRLRQPRIRAEHNKHRRDAKQAMKDRTLLETP
ncbi:MAG: hypothetical protein ACLPSW_30280, partial [Roseiarcus sp.]